MDAATKNFCEIEGHTLAYFRKGKGEPVLLVHGITTYSFIWRKIIPHLEKNMDVIAVDLLGCGASSKELNDSYSLKNQARLLHRFVNELGIEKFHLVGHDVGGGIAQIFAVNHPELLYDLTLVNSVGYDFWPVQPIVAMRTPIIRQLAMASLDMGFFERVIRRGLYHEDALTPELLSCFKEPLQYRAGRKAFLHLAACLNNHDLMEIAEDLCRLELPVLVIRGEADRYLSGEIMQRLVRDIPQAQSLLIETAGHFIQEDEPDLLSQAIIDFISGGRDDE